jgi:hypothetical protein
VFGPTKSSDIIRTVSTTFYDHADGFTFNNRVVGISGPSHELSRINVGVTGPSGASSGVDNFTAFTVETLVLGASGGLTI